MSVSVHIRRVGPFLCVRDAEGLRHLIRVASVQIVSDADPVRDETLLTAANRTFRVPTTIEDVAAALDPDLAGHAGRI